MEISLASSGETWNMLTPLNEFLFLNCDADLVLYRRGWPTSVILLFLMIVAKFSLPLSCHPPLGLHHLLRLVGAARRLVTLRSIEILQIGARMAGARVAKLQGMRSRAMPRCNSAVYIPISATSFEREPLLSPAAYSIFSESCSG